MNIPADLKYTKDHEWIRSEGGKAYIGITDFAQHSLGDIVFIELPETGKVLKVGESLGVVESVKAVSEVYCPLAGKVVEVNEVLADAPERINENPYDSWIAAIEISDSSETNLLLSPQEYEDFCSREE